MLQLSGSCETVYCPVCMIIIPDLLSLCKITSEIQVNCLTQSSKFPHAPECSTASRCVDSGWCHCEGIKSFAAAPSLFTSEPDTSGVLRLHQAERWISFVSPSLLFCWLSASHHRLVYSLVFYLTNTWIVSVGSCGFKAP